MSGRGTPIRWAYLVALVLVLSMPPTLLFAAGEGRISKVVAEHREGGVQLSVELADGLPEEVAQEIKNGVPKELFYTISLRHPHRRWFDEDLGAWTVHYTIKHDTLEGRYHIRRTGINGDEAEEQVVPTFEAAMRVILRLKNVFLELPAASLDSSDYLVVKAEMRAVKLPLHLDYVFFFFPVLEFETPWARTPPLNEVP
ncbi:MAG: DUF4390 domain-containing protein [Leptospirillia bacterium]